MQPATPTAPIVTRDDLPANVVSFARRMRAANLSPCHTANLAPRDLDGGSARQLGAGETEAIRWAGAATAATLVAETTSSTPATPNTCARATNEEENP